ncbi:zf-HC2 domain-containing protein [Desulfosarcina sp.]|uniref:anti-sigma factor family protein n=1 Tax=Desulfosarcina sp. TaxID=2027861 RepID=UPI003970F3CF
MKLWMLRCQDVSQKVSQSMDASLPLSHRLAVRMHLMMCRYCARFQRQLVMLRQLSRAEDPYRASDKTPENLSETTKRRIKEKLRSIH